VTLTICQIVTQLPPAINGVGDYALNLARQLRQDYQVETHFLVCDPTWQGDETIEGFRVSQIKERQAKCLSDCISLISTPKLLLHYVNYGYAKRGCPLWLIEGLKQIKRELSPRLITMFHEVYAFSPYPWHSSFWLSGFQKSIASQLSGVTDYMFTSKQLYADILTSINNNKIGNINVIPVFSNVGEPVELPLELSKRNYHLIIFGSIVNRKNVYKNCISMLSRVCQRLNIEKIIDIGDSFAEIPSRIDDVPVEKKGKLTSDAISKILGESLVGFSNYHPDFLAKSTIFAAYCAHRILPVNFHGNILGADGIRVNVHYLSKETELEVTKIQLIADNAYNWYMSHNIKNQTRSFYNSLIQ
jgi:hypothetical protein